MKIRERDYSDYIGKKYNKLTILKHVGYKCVGNKYHVAIMLCECDCGNTKEVDLECLKKRAGTKSCGCLIKIAHNKAHKKHGMSNTPEFKSWDGLIQRCKNKNDKAYHNYGGRGITVCDRWMESFENFYADMGAKPSRKHSIDRINNNGNYEPSNCRWATYSQQNYNRRMPHNRYITYNNETHHIKGWAEKYNIDSGTFYSRLKRMSFEDAISRPVKNRIKQK